MSAEGSKPKCEKCGGETETVDGPFTITAAKKHHTIYGHGSFCKKCKQFFPSEQLSSRVMVAEDW